MITCQELTELVTTYLERRLPFVQRMRFQMHLGICGPCRTYLRQMRQTVDTLGRLPADRLDPEARARLLEQFRNWKN